VLCVCRASSVPADENFISISDGLDDQPRTVGDLSSKVVMQVFKNSGVLF
jgi:hypothetical protein